MSYGQGGYPQQQQGPGNDIRSWFLSVDRDRSGQIDALELQQALINGNMSKFSEETCKMMISMFDHNRSGTIDVNEFGQLFNYVNQWRGLFMNFDRDRSGSIETNEFASALNQLGFNFSPNLVNNILSKQNPKTKMLTLDSFILVLTQIRRLTESFKSRDREMRGQALIGYEDFIGLALGAHH